VDGLVWIDRSIELIWLECALQESDDQQMTILAGKALEGIGMHG
jgi:hypothetical protein